MITLQIMDGALEMFGGFFFPENSTTGVTFCANVSGPNEIAIDIVIFIDITFGKFIGRPDLYKK